MRRLLALGTVIYLMRLAAGIPALHDNTISDRPSDHTGTYMADNPIF